ncbi:hypothetical protein Pcac1_g22500 [Phytophthora cactorum]|nr:hypothetical protein Pcac1_g22500 [Phytophthora cactorum]
MHATGSGTDTSVEEQVQLRRVVSTTSARHATPTTRAQLEKLSEKMQGVKSPEVGGSLCMNASPLRSILIRSYMLTATSSTRTIHAIGQDTKRDHYMKEKLKYLATLQDEVNLGRELGKKGHLEEVIWQVNDNLDGAICFEEFVNSYVRSRNDRSGLEPSEIFFLTCFLMFDKECCGRISLDDAMGILYLKYGEAMEREMEIHFGKLLDEGAHFVTFVEFQPAPLSVWVSSSTSKLLSPTEQILQEA